MTAVTLTLLDQEDLITREQHGAEAACRARLVSPTEEARDQNALLSLEYLAQILTCDVRTVRRDIQTLGDKQDLHTTTRGQQKDITPGVTHHLRHPEMDVRQRTTRNHTPLQSQPNSR